MDAMDVYDPELDDLAASEAEGRRFEFVKSARSPGGFSILPLASLHSLGSIVTRRCAGWNGGPHLPWCPARPMAPGTALASKVSVITGGPGVGKTTIVNRLRESWPCNALNAAAETVRR